MRIDWQRLFKPLYWSQLYRTCWEWDGLLNQILDKAEKVEKRAHTVTIDGVEIWTSNWPYAYGSPYVPMKKFDVLPSVATRKRLKKVVENYNLDDVKRFWSKA